mgnify:CR=1 FL=1
MAEQTILGLTLKEYQEQIENLKASLLELKDGSAEYEVTLELIRDMQNNLNVVMSESKSENESLGKSYNSLVEELNRLKNEWKSTTDEVERNSLAKQISLISSEIKELDVSFGVFDRDIADYSNKFGSSIKKMGSSFKELSKGFKIASNSSKALKSGLDLISKHPIMAFVTLLITIFMSLADKFKENTKLMAKLQAIMDVFTPIVDAASEALQYFVEVIADSIGWLFEAIGLMDSYDDSIDEATSKIEGNTEAIDKNNESLKENKRLKEELKMVEERNATNEKEIIDNTYKIEEKRRELSKLSGKEKINTQKEIYKLIVRNAELEEQKAQRVYYQYKMAYEDAVKAGKDTVDLLKQTTDAYKTFLNAKSKFNQAITDQKNFDKNPTVTLSGGTGSVRRNTKEDAKKKAQEVSKTFVEEFNKEIKSIQDKASYDEMIADFNIRLYSIQGDTESVKKYTEERYNIVVKELNEELKKYDEILKNEKLTESDRAKLVEQRSNLVVKIEKTNLDHRISQETDALNKIKNGYKKNVDDIKKIYDQDSFNLDNKFISEYVKIAENYQNRKITYEEYLKQIEELQSENENKALDIEVEKNTKLLETAQNYANEMLEKYGEYSTQYLEAKAAAGEAEVKLQESINKKLNNITNKQVNTTLSEEKKKKKAKEDTLNYYSKFSQSMQQILGEESAAAKAFAISEAIISTWRGVSGILAESNAVWGGGPWGLAAKYVAIASVITSGLANVKNIISESTSSGEVTGGASTGLSGAVVSPLLNNESDMYAPQPVYNTNQEDQRVYVVESDITDVQNRSKVRVEESSF